MSRSGSGGPHPCPGPLLAREVGHVKNDLRDKTGHIRKRTYAKAS